MNASKHKYQIQMPPKPWGFPKNILTKLFVRILSSLQPILFEISMVEIARVTISHFLTILAQVGGVLMLVDLKICFPANVSVETFVQILRFQDVRTVFSFLIPYCTKQH